MQKHNGISCEVPEYYSKHECLWKQKGKEEGHSKWLGYVDRNEVIHVCRTLRNFRFNLEQEKNN